MQTKKWQIILVIAALTVLASGAVWILTQNQEEVCSERGMAGECLPEGKCAAPNDAIVSCEKLRQNPEKTDWFGNE